MFSQSLFTFVLASITVVNAVNICAFSDTLGCSGASVCCNNIAPSGCCSPIPAGFGFAVEYEGLPGAVSDGQAWTGTSCLNGPIFTDQIGTGNKCYVGGGTKAGSAAWVNSASRRSAADGPVQKPDTFKYTSEGGVEKAVSIPDLDGAVATMLEMYKAGNFSGIEAHAAAN